MKPKTIVTAVLLLFVAASVAAIFIKESRRPPAASPSPAPAAPRKIIAYYFHGNVRCPTCRKMEALANEALQSGFADELKSGRLEWRVVNLDEPGNELFVQDYQLETRSLVLADIQDGKQTRWKNLKRIWDLVRDDQAFVRYVQDEARAYLESR
jgi:hypothetical protein